ncbi:MAG TPA: hypothetical protein VF699_11025 [Caulobacteraceae bacterium]|jgi:hypothetical protein
MRPHDPKLALSATETESLRAMRSKISRPPPGDAALGVVGRAYFEVCARAGLPAAGDAGAVSAPALVEAAASADMARLTALLGSLRAVLQRSPAEWRAAIAAGAPQAVMSRRLALAGREARLDVAEDA